MINDVHSMKINKIRSYFPVQSCLLDSFVLCMNINCAKSDKNLDSMSF